MDETKIAVIGLGGIAQLVHLPNLAKINNVKVTAVAEIKKNRLNTIADKFNVPDRYTDYNDLLQKSDVDAVIIATPTSTHKDVAIDCLKAQKDVLVEKPLARSYEEAEAVIDTAKKYDRKLIVGMNLRYRPDAMLLKSLLNSKEIGEPFFLKCGWIRRQSSSKNWFTQKEESGGGVILDLGILLLDLSLWLLDYPQVNSVSTTNYYHNTENVEDTSISYIRAKDLTIGLETSWSLPLEKDIFYLNVYGTEGNASLNPFKVYKKMEEHLMDLSPAKTESGTSLFKKSYLNELKNFIGVVRGLNPDFSSGEEVLSRMKVLDLMYKSAKNNSEIKL